MALLLGVLGGGKVLMDYLSQRDEAEHQLAKQRLENENKQKQRNLELERTKEESQAKIETAKLQTKQEQIRQDGKQKRLEAQNLHQAEMNYLNQKAETERQLETKRLENEDNQKQRNFERERAREANRAQLEAAKLQNEYEEIRQEGEQRRLDTQNRHQADMFNRQNEQLKEISDQTQQIHRQALENEERAAEQDRLRIEDEERRHNQHLDEMRKNNEKIHNDHKQAMAMREKRNDELMRANAADRKAIEEQRKQELARQKEVEVALKQEQKEKRNQLEKHMLDAMKRQDEEGKRLFAELDKQLDLMNRRQAEEKLQLQDIIDTDEQKYKEKLNALNEESAKISKVHDDIMADYRNSLKELEKQRLALDEIKREFVQQNLEISGKMQDGISKLNPNETYNQILDRNREHANDAEDLIQDIQTTLANLEYIGSGEKRSKELSKLSFHLKRLEEHIRLAMKSANSGLISLDSLELQEHGLKDHAKEKLQAAVGCYKNINSKYPKLQQEEVEPNREVIGEIIGDVSELVKNFQDLRRAENAVGSIARELLEAAMRPTESVRVRMEQVAIEGRASTAHQAQLPSNSQNPTQNTNTPRQLQDSALDQNTNQCVLN